MTEARISNGTKANFFVPGSQFAVLADDPDFNAGCARLANQGNGPLHQSMTEAAAPEFRQHRQFLKNANAVFRLPKADAAASASLAECQQECSSKFHAAANVRVGDERGMGRAIVVVEIKPLRHVGKGTGYHLRNSLRIAPVRQPESETVRR
ncbi:MAG: hypothetical protein ABSD21_09105 [Rhizomicrobium sp.]